MYTKRIFCFFLTQKIYNKNNEKKKGERKHEKKQIIS